MEKSPEEELIKLIESLLDKPCETNLPRLCEFVKTAEGKETAVVMIKNYCIENGCSVQQAMAHIDGEI